MSIPTNSPIIPRSEPIPTPPRKSPEQATVHPLIDLDLSASWKEFIEMMKEDLAEQNADGYFPDSHGNYPDRHGNYPRKSDFHGFSLHPTLDSYSDNNTSSGSSCFSSKAGSRAGSLGSSFQGSPESQGSYSLCWLFDGHKTIEKQNSSDLSTGSAGSRATHATAPILGPKNKENCSNQSSEKTPNAPSSSNAQGKEEETEEASWIFPME